MDCAWLCDKHKRNNQCFFCKKNINNTYPYNICGNCRTIYGNNICSNTYKCFICGIKNYSPTFTDLQSLYVCENCYKQQKYSSNFGENHCYKCGSKLS